MYVLVIIVSMSAGSPGTPGIAMNTHHVEFQSQEACELVRDSVEKDISQWVDHYSIRCYKGK